jgi:hypothetical protein
MGFRLLDGVDCNVKVVAGVLAARLRDAEREGAWLYLAFLAGAIVTLSVNVSASFIWIGCNFSHSGPMSDTLNNASGDSLTDTAWCTRKPLANATPPRLLCGRTG